MISEGMSMVLECINTVLLSAYFVYLYSSMALGIRKVMGLPRWPLANLLWYWSKWPALVFIYLSPIIVLLQKGELNWWTAPSVAMSTVAWWLYRNEGDDDDHKKLKKKLKEKVHVLGGKLVVIPEPA
jgi:hypothetical protein